MFQNYNVVFVTAESLSTKRELFARLDKKYISGITFSGGDPLHPANRMDVRNLMAEIRERYPGKTIWLYTGDTWENIREYPLMRYVDVLVDGEFQIDKKDAKLLWKGSSNQRVIDVQASLRQQGADEPPVLHCGDYAGDGRENTGTPAGPVCDTRK